jgi:thioesterase domain-containing protein/NAD(P)-dependent dehydrogenase (short-subunit alcohol dehydrogenase family)/acyl carrier protein
MRRLAALELAASDVGASVMFTSADLADPTSVASILDDVFARVGAVDGVIHAAGRLLDRPIELLSHDDAMSVLGARTTAALALTAESARRSIGLVVLIGSTSAILAPAGQTSYVASNAVLGALAGQVGPTRVVTVDFGVWAGTGMSADILRRQRLGDGDETFDHPVFNRGRNRRDGGYELFGELAAEDWLVAEHRLADGTRVLSGSGHLALYLGALEAVGMDPFVLEDLTLLAPVAVADGATVALRLTIDPPGGAYRRVALDADGGTGREWLSSSEAIIKPRAEEQAADASLDPETFPPASALSKTTTTQVLARPSRRLRLGPRWSVDSALGSSDEVPTESARVVRARLRLAKPFRSESRPWLAHPALVDVATAVAVSLTPDRSEVLYLPVRYGAVSHKVRHLDEVLLEVQVVATDAGAIVQLHFSDPHGVGVLEVRDLELVALEGPLRVDGPLTPLIEHDQPSSLVDLADELGIRADDGPEALDRALARGLPHVILSSVALDLLSQLQTRRERAPKHDGAHGSLQTRLAGWWEEFLGIPVGPDDDFFEVGGHSLIAIRVLARVHREIGVRLPIAAFFDAPTVRTLSALIEAEGRLGEVPSFLQADVNRASLREATTSVANRPAAIVVPMRASGTKRPLFIVHGAGGNVMNLWGFARNLPKDRPVYAFQAVGADGVESPDESVEAMAARYVQALISIQPDGPCLIAGYSGGGIVALEISRQLAEVGRTTSLVVLIDTPLPGDWYLALLPQLVRATRTAFRDGPMAVAPWVRHKASRLAVHMHLRRPNARERAMTEVYTDVERIGLVNLELPFAEMVSRYVIRSYPTNALLVKAKVDLAVQTSTYGWDSYIEGRLDTITVTGSHQSMFMSEHVGELAAAVESYLVLSDAEALSSSADERC